MELLDANDVAEPREGSLVSVAAKFTETLDEQCQRNSQRQREEIESLSELDESSALWEINRRLHRESRGLQATHVLRGFELPEACPEPDKEAARLAAQGGLSLADFLKCYRVGHSCTMEAWLQAVSEADLSPDERAEYLPILWRFVTEYDDRIVDFVAKEYERQRQQVEPKPGGTRIELFRELIEGNAGNAAALGYELDQHHIGVVAAGPEATSALSALAQKLDQRLLLVEVEAGLVMGWLGSQRNSSSARALVRGFHPPAGTTTIGFGNVRFGYEGLRRTHTEASDAYGVALRRPQPLTFYDDVILEVLALRDEKAAREFIADVLRSLDEETKGAEVLRETLRAYFNAEQNAVATAAALGIHAVTVRRHLDQIERRIGYRVNQRRAELESALRVRALFAPNSSSPVA
jgi:hypothetical protein